MVKGETMANSHEIIAASADADLLDRAMALGLSLGISENGVKEAFRRIVAGNVEVDNEETSVAVMYAQAQAAYDEAVKNLPPTPGKNLEAVTDDVLSAAILKYSYIVVP